MTAKSKEHVVLIGMRGAGKTSVGRELARLTRSTFVDTDEVIVVETGCNIAEVFQKEGEAGFRRREHELIVRLCAAPPRVLAVGGGAVVDPRNTALFHKIFHVVWLTSPVEVLHQRIESDPGTSATRPPLGDKGPGTSIEELRRVLAARDELYAQAADIRMDTSSVTPDHVALEIATRLNWSMATPD